MAKIDNIIKRPLLTEKATLQAEQNNRYGFVVALRANKNMIRNAVETMFDVKVEKIWTSTTPGKIKRAGKGVKKTSPIKKAYVQVSQGQKIEFFKGV